MSRQKGESARLTRQLSIRVTEDEYAQIERMAQADERLLTDMARLTFRDGLPVRIDKLRARGVEIPDEPDDDTPA